MRCLVVGIEPDLLALVSGALAARGHDVVASPTPDEAWPRCQQEPFALTIVDCRRPELGGVAFVRRVAVTPSPGAVVALTSADEPSAAAAALEAGAGDYIASPIDAGQLAPRLTVVERLAAATQARAEAEVEHARLLDAAQTARTEAERASHRLGFLAEASAVLASSLDYETTLSNVARLAVPLIADYCIFDVLEEGRERPRQVALVHVDPDKAEILRDMRRRYPPRLTGPNPGTRALATGQSVLAPEVPPGLLGELAQDEEQAEMLRRLEVRSYMGVPVVVRGRTIGAITLVAGVESERRFGAADLALAEDLARRAAIAVDNARLYREAQRATDRIRALAWAATEAQSASHELAIFETIDAAIVRSGLNVHASLVADGSGPARLVIWHVALTEPALLPTVERLLGRPIVGIQMDVDGIEPFRTAVREVRVAVTDAASLLRETLPWMTPRASQVIGRLRQVGQAMVVPIANGQTALGVLSIWGETLGEADLAPMELLGRQAGAALAALRQRLSVRESSSPAESDATGGDQIARIQRLFGDRAPNPPP